MHISHREVMLLLLLVATVIGFVNFTLVTPGSSSQSAQVGATHGQSVAERARQSTAEFRQLVQSGVRGPELASAAMIRASVLRTLMQTDPQAVLDTALSEEELAALPENVQQYLEKHVTVTGEYQSGFILREDGSEEFHELTVTRDTSYTLYPVSDSFAGAPGKLTVRGVRLEDEIAFSEYDVEFDLADGSGSVAPSESLEGERLLPGTMPWYVIPALEYSSGYHRWNYPDAYGTPVTVTYMFADEPPPYLDPTEQLYTNFSPFNEKQRQLVRALAQEVTGATELTLVEVTDINTAQIVIWNVSDLGGILGISYKPGYHGGGANSKIGDFVINASYSNPEPNSTDYRVIVHELSHSLGSGHPTSIVPSNEQISTLYAATGGSSEPVSRTFGFFDHAFFQYLYGADSTTSVGDDVYSVTDGSTAKAIWDGGGFDTISAANDVRGEGVRLTLTPGNPSLMSYTPVNEYWERYDTVIGYGACIERAVGSSYADIIMGNHFNVNTGCPGPDHLTGNGGADTFRFYPDWGEDVIEDFEDGIDTIDLRSIGITISDMVKSSDGSDTVLTYNGNMIRVSNTAAADITDADLTSNPGDNEAPSAYFMSGSNVNGHLNQAGTYPRTLGFISEDDIITKVEFFLDGELYDTFTAPPYRTNWTITSADNGQHTWLAKIYDGNGNIGEIENTPTVEIVDESDSTPPTISNISAGAINDTSVTISFLTDEAAETRVEYGTDTSYGMSTALSALTTSHTRTISSLQPETTYHFRAHATDASGNSSVSSDQTFTTLAESDTTPPSVTLTVPSSGATVSGTVSITAEATDDTGVSQVDFFLDGALIRTDTTALYDAAWDTTASSDGSHTLSVTAYDAAGNAASDSVSVTVENDVTGSSDTTAPVISNITDTDTSDSTSVNHTISWETNEPATTELWYGTHQKRINSVYGDTALTTSHDVTLTGLDADSWYYYYVVSTDEAGNKSTSDTLRFRSGSTGSDSGGSDGGPNKCTPGAQKKGEC